MEKKKEVRGRRKTDIVYEGKNKEQLAAFAKVVEELIAEANLTQKEFAARGNISISTINKIFNPVYARIPSITSIKKIAGCVDKDKQLIAYKRLMDAVGYSIIEYPFSNNTLEAITESNQVIVDNMYELLARALNKIDKFYKLEEKSNIIGNYNRKVFFQDGPITEWVIYFVQLGDLKINQIPDELLGYSALTVNAKDFANILADGAKATSKYTLYYPDKRILAPLTEMLNIPTLNTTISIMYEENGELKEEYINTGISPDVYKDYRI